MAFKGLFSDKGEIVFDGCMMIFDNCVCLTVSLGQFIFQCCNHCIIGIFPLCDLFSRPHNLFSMLFHEANVRVSRQAGKRELQKFCSSHILPLYAGMIVLNRLYVYCSTVGKRKCCRFLTISMIVCGRLHDWTLIIVCVMHRTLMIVCHVCVMDLNDCVDHSAPLGKGVVAVL